MQTKSFPVIPPLSYPFPHGKNLHLAELEKLVPQWIDQFDFLSKDIREKYKKSRFDEISAWFWPNAGLKVLIPMCRWMVWVFVYDDFYDPYPPDQIRMANERSTEILQGSAPTGEDNELFHQIALVRDGCLACGATPGWMERFIQSHELYFNGKIIERAYNYRSSLRCPSIEKIESIRRDSIGMYPTIDFVELEINFILPTEVATHSLIERLRDLASDFVALDNDIYSLRKDLYRNETINRILVIQNELGCSLQEAYDETFLIRESKIKEFLNIIDALPDFGDSEINEHVRRCIYNLKLMIHGHLIWTQNTKRYNDDSVFFIN